MKGQLFQLAVVTAALLLAVSGFRTTGLDADLRLCTAALLAAIWMVLHELAGWRKL